ncbi:MAG: hypothetical protein ABL904_16435 [Hyphomicrobiaceae bacterium]
MKPIPIMEAALARRLKSRGDLRLLGITVERHQSGGVELASAGRRLGTWHWRAKEFVFEPEGGGRHITAHTILGAVALTASLLNGDD